MMSIDKPIPAKIILSFKNKDESVDIFIGLSASLYQNNLIYSEPRELRKTKESLELSVIFRSKYVFKNWLSHSQIVKYWDKRFKDLLIKKPETLEEINVIIEVDEIQNCVCDKSEFYILQGRSLQFTDELTCGSCLKQLPYSKIPVSIQIEKWQRYYQRYYLNWLESGIFETEALKELTNYSEGKLNMLGEQIRAELSSHFNIPVYLSYFVEEPDHNHSCLICGEEGVDSGLMRPSKICQNCNTIFD